jgi:DNA repair photolyase
MTRSSALRRPPAPLPSAPAGETAGAAQGAAQGAVQGTGHGTGHGTGLGTGLGTVVDRDRRRGRGTASNASGRYEPLARVAFDDGWQGLEDLPPFKTTVTADSTRKIITRNDSPDISFDRSINPYRGCEHGCVYCFARPTHAYLGLSPGLDFESKLFMKPNAQELLERELAAPGYVPKIIAIGTNTDPYQPIERRQQIMRRILEVLDNAGHPVGIVTKSALVLRDLDILARMAKRDLVKVAISVTTLDAKLARTMEPRASTPPRRLEALKQLVSSGVPASAMLAPIIPALNDAEIERILDAVAATGVRNAGYVLLRLPLELRDLFREWLIENFPDRYRHVISLIRDTRGGKDYDSTFGKRMTGSGPIAWMIGRRFEVACERLGFNVTSTRTTTEHFRRPRPASEQLDLF